MDMLSKFITPGVGFLLTLAFGFWLGRIGKPYNGLLFNIHKLISLGAVVVTAIQVYKSFNLLEPRFMFVVLIVLAGLCVAALFASGAFLSIGNVNYQVAKTIHNIAMGLSIVVLAAVYLFTRGFNL
jgi:hypothetical protein